MEVFSVSEAPPKDREILLFLDGGPTFRHWSIGKWDDDKYAKSPRPYWRADAERVMGKVWMRNSQPTHWAELPAKPR